MWLTRFITVLLGLAALGASKRRCPGGTNQDEFVLMAWNSSIFELTAVNNGTDQLVLQAVPGDHGTCAYANITATGSNYNTTLVLVLTNSTTVPAGGYGLYVPDLGSLHGATASVQAQKDSQDFGFEVEGGNVILHEMTSASQSWYACTDSLVNGTQSIFLRWGVSQ